ncbi:hypothetical protein D9M70_533750 [compost metagenome]
MLYRDQHVFLLIGDRVAERLRPLEVFAHHLNDLGVVEQRNDATVPIVLWFHVRLLLASLQEPFRLDDLQRIERGSGNKRHQFVRIERDACDQNFELVVAEGFRRRLLLSGWRTRRLLGHDGRDGR